MKAGREILIETLSTEISLGIKEFVDITHSFCASELILSCTMSTSLSILFSFVLLNHFSSSKKSSGDLVLSTVQANTRALWHRVKQISSVFEGHRGAFFAG